MRRKTRRASGRWRHERPPFILDAHIHCRGTEAWVREMVDAYGRRGAMACAITWPRDLELMVDAMRSHPEVNPHTLKGGPGAWEHVVFGTDEGPDGLEANIGRFQRMLDANAVPEAARERMWGLTMAGVLGIDPATRRRTAAAL